MSIGNGIERAGVDGDVAASFGATGGSQYVDASHARVLLILAASARDMASNIVRARGHPATPTCPIRMEELAARFIDALVGVGAEEVSLGLQQVCRKTGRAESVIERK